MVAHRQQRLLLLAACTLRAAADRYAADGTSLLQQGVAMGEAGASKQAEARAAPAPAHSTDMRAWLSVAVAMLCFGTFGVPIKTKAVQEAQVHPLVFQSYKSFWVLATCWFVLLWEDFHFSPWGFLSGVFWVPAGTAAVVAINNVGLAVGQATFQVTIVIVSFLWGCVGFREPLRSVPTAVVAVLMLVSGLLGMTYVASLSSQPKAQAGETEPLMAKDPTGKGKALAMTAAQRLGLAAALFNGCWGGSNLVPMKFAHLSGPKFIISFAVGAATVNIAMWILLATWYWLRDPSQSVWARLPPLHIGVMKVQGTISGLLWSVGNFASMYAVKELGQAIGYSCVQSSIFVSGLWGILYYREIRGPSIGLWLASAGLALAGVVLLAKQRG